MTTEIRGPEGVTREQHVERGEDVWETDRVDAFSWAALFVWGALVLLATYTTFQESYDWWDGWGVFFVGAGAVVLIETLIRLFLPDYRWKWWWSLMWGTVFLSLGLSSFFGGAWLALALVAFAVVTLRGAFSSTS